MAGAILACAGAAPALGQSANPPDLMTYQGYLVDANGLPLANSNPVNYTVVFRIYSVSSGGSSLWAEAQTVTVDKGTFSVVLGEGVVEGSEPRPALSSLFASGSASDRYIGITVRGVSAGDPEILPRIRMLTSPYSFLARSANGLVTPQGTELLVPDAGRLRVSQAIQSTGGNARGAGAVDLQVVRQSSQPAQVASGEASTLSGGESNKASGPHSVVAGGKFNTASAQSSTVVGGEYNTASAFYATVVGGRQNEASGELSFAAGRRARATHSGAFVWSDNQDSDFASTGNNVFMVRASGGMAINTTPESGVDLKVIGKIKAGSVEATTFTVGTLNATTLNGFGTTPLGGIIMWSGSTAAVPDGWALCDGRSSEGRTTPDLRGRFVMGSDGTRSVGTRGGNETVSLTAAQLPKHTHRVTGNTSSGGGHTHPIAQAPTDDRNFTGGLMGVVGDKGNVSYSNSEAMFTGNRGDHSHSMDFDSGQNSGTAQSVNILPPYYALAFIMRVK